MRVEDLLNKLRSQVTPVKLMVKPHEGAEAQEVLDYPSTRFMMKLERFSPGTPVRYDESKPLGEFTKATMIDGEVVLE